ncbi:LAMI_0F01046g1_1 [Lachancea mirantina]|uniref:Autophagy-related protein n=1 Tax=Lachancea mirantina TaxID=1230905 RepID=A0A1G4JVW1_9SACH|nr:LAMI_0F01046g1_1 [Lachancea mirantina]
MSYRALPTGGDDVVFDNLRKKVRDNFVGWYLYAFSSEPFIVSAVSTYVPLLLEQFARINGVKVEDHSVSCANSDGQCVLGLFGGRWHIDTSSFALYTFSLSVLFQTLLVISVSGVVDRWKSVKFKGNVVVVFGIVGAISTLIISQLKTSQFYSLAIFSIMANCCYGVVNVVGNSLLPIFVADSIKVTENLSDSDSEKITSITSGRGSGLGYLGALVVQIVSIVLVKRSKSHDNIQLAVLLVGLWWLVWQTPMTWLLQDLAPIDPEGVDLRFTNIKRYVGYGWKSLFESLRNARLMKDVMIFLIGWFIISDSITTINSTAILFAKTELKMTTVNLIVVSVLSLVSGIIGAFVVPELLSARLKLSPQHSLMAIICWASVIPFYGTLGFFLSSVGLKHKFEMYFLAIWYGISMGGLAAVSRSIFSLIIPPGKESTFFSLFNVTDKGSSILGPALVGFLTDRTHNIRYSFYLLLLLLIVSLPVFRMLDVDRGKREAKEISDLAIE